MKSNFTYAPVLIITLSRYDHFTRCIESLSSCTGANETDLFIGLDYPPNDSHRKGYYKILEYIDSIDGFKSVNIFKRETNFGVKKNITELRNHVMELYDRFIFSEDDNEFAPNFLEYINKGLEKYKENEKVFAICGFSYPQITSFPGYKHNAYPMKGFTAWGTGYWRHKFKQYHPIWNNEKATLNVINSYKTVRKIFKEKCQITVHRLLFRSKSAYGDLMWHVFLLIENKYCIFPRISKVRNLGFDGSGLNCKQNDIFKNHIIDKNPTFEFETIEIKDYKPIQKVHNTIYGGNWWIRRGCEIEYVFFKLFGLNTTQIRRSIKSIFKQNN